MTKEGTRRPQICQSVTHSSDVGQISQTLPAHSLTNTKPVFNELEIHILPKKVEDGKVGIKHHQTHAK